MVQKTLCLWLDKQCIVIFVVTPRAFLRFDSREKPAPLDDLTTN